MGLVQLFRDVPYPDLLARELLASVLADFCETGHHYLLHLSRSRDTAYVNGTDDQVEALDAEIREHQIHQQIPYRWKLDDLFSYDAYLTFGDGILPFWAVVLIQICVLEQHWEDVLLGDKTPNPHLLPGFHSDAEVWSTDWLKDYRRTWATELTDVYPEFGHGH